MDGYNYLGPESEFELLNSWFDRDLKFTKDNAVSYNSRVMKNVDNKIINFFHKFRRESSLVRLNKRKEKLESRLEKINEQIKKIEQSVEDNKKEDNVQEELAAEVQEIMKEAEKSEKNEQKRFLNFKPGIKQKVSSFKSRLGRIKNSVLEKLHLTNIDVKIRNAFDRAKLWGLSALNSGAKAVNKVKNGVTNFTSSQIAKYREWRADKEQEDNVQEEIAAEVQEIMKEAEKSEMKESKRFLNFKPGIKQKVSSLKSRLGRIKNSILEKLNLSNIDVKIKNAFDQAKLWGLSALNSGVRTVNKVKDGVTNFTSLQITKYQQWRISRQQEKEHAARLKEAEKMSEQQIRERTKDHKKGMIEAGIIGVVDARERDEYDKKHQEYINQKQELINSLIAEKNKLLNRTSVYEEVAEEDKKSYHK